jgi:hypothetical protein
MRWRSAPVSAQSARNATDYHTATSAAGVRREKAALSSGVQIPPGIRSSRRLPEMSALAGGHDRILAVAPLSAHTTQELIGGLRRRCDGWAVAAALGRADDAGGPTHGNRRSDAVACASGGRRRGRAVCGPEETWPRLGGQTHGRCTPPAYRQRRQSADRPRGQHAGAGRRGSPGASERDDGGCCRCRSTTAPRLVASARAVVGVYVFDWPIVNGIVYEPGAAQVASVSYT